jgi:hypothetical protein
VTFMYEDESQALAHLAYYQELLRLQDWDLELAFHVSAMDIGSLTAHAHIRWDMHHRKARLKLIDPQGYGDDFIEIDEEHSIVHELLHLKMVDFDNTESDSLEGHLLEGFINQLSTAIVKLRRERDDARNKATSFEADLLAHKDAVKVSLQLATERKEEQ